jgi:hypothetical protein
MNLRDQILPVSHFWNGRIFQIAITALFGALFILLLFVLNVYIAGLGGNYEKSDFMVLWLSGKGIVSGTDLYDPQSWAALHATYAPYYQDNEIFIFPLPTALLFVPFSFMPPRWSGAAWLAINEGLTILYFTWVIGKTHYKKKLSKILFFALLVATFQPVLITILSGQYSLIMLIFLAAVYILFHKKMDWSGGVLTGFLLLRPNPFVFFIPGVLIFALWQKRWKYLAGFAAGIAGIFFISELIRPAWIGTWLDYTIGGQGKLYTYGVIAPTLRGILNDIGSSLSPLVRNGINLIVTVLLFLLGIFVILRKNVSQGYVFSILITISLCITPYAWNYDQVLLLFPLAYLIMSQQTRSTCARRLIWLLVFMVFSVFPYLLRYVAIVRGTDTLSGLVPFSVLFLLLFTGIYNIFPTQLKKDKIILAPFEALP